MKINKFIGDRRFYNRLFTVMIPILIQNVITNFVSLLDNVMVGQIGTESMSGVAIVNQLLFIFNLCIFGGLAGPGIFTAQYYGKGDDNGVRYTVRAKIYTAVAMVAVFLTIFSAFGSQLISQFLHQGEEALDLAATLTHGMNYLHVMLIQMVPFAIMQIYASTLRETGETMLPMKAGIIAVFVNLILNYILIFGKLGFPVLGVVGAAIATVIARFVECGIVVIWAHANKEKNSYIEGLYSSPKIPGLLAKQIVVLGMPLLINELLWSGGMTLLNQCYSMRGLEVVSAVNIQSTVSNLFFCAFFAMGSTISIMVGQLLGANEIERAVDEDRKLIFFSVVISTATGVVMALMSPYIPRIYNTSETVRHLAYIMLLITALNMPIHSFTHASYFTLRSGGKTIITFIFDSGFVWVILIPVALFLSRATSIPIIPMFLIIQAMEIVKAGIGFVLLKKKSWVNNLVKD